MAIPNIRDIQGMPARPGGAGNPKSEARNPKQIRMDGNGVIGKREAAKFLRQRRGILAPPRKTESWRDRIINRRFIRRRLWWTARPDSVLVPHDSAGLPLGCGSAALAALDILVGAPPDSQPLANAPTPIPPHADIAGKQRLAMPHRGSLQYSHSDPQLDEKWELVLKISSPACQFRGSIGISCE